MMVEVPGLAALHDGGAAELRISNPSYRKTHAYCFALLLTEAHIWPRSLHSDLAFLFYSQDRGRMTVDMMVEVPGLAA